MEKQAKVRATITLEFTVCGDLPYAIEKGYKNDAHSIAHSLVEDAIDSCCYTVKDMHIEDVEYEVIT